MPPKKLRQFAVRLAGMLSAASLSLLLCLLTLVMLGFGLSSVSAASENDDTKSHATSNQRKQLPRYSQLNDQVSALILAETKARNETERLWATLAIVEMTNQLRRDPRFESSPTLQETRSRLVTRLRRVKKRELTSQRRNARSAKQGERRASIQVDDKVLAQLRGMNAVNRRNQANRAQANRAQANPRQVNQANPNQINAPADYGPMLVDLIQTTISPPSWDVNGGSSTIRYWQPGAALVVRAPGGLHEEVGPLLNQLRKN